MFNRGPYALQHWTKTSLNQQTATFPWITSDFGDLANSPYGNVVPGSMLSFPWYDQFGNAFTLKRVRASALVVGNTTQWYVLDTAGGHGTDTATGASTTSVITLTTGGLVVNELTQNAAWIYDEVISRTGTPTTDGLKLVKAQTAANLVTISVVDTKVSNRQQDADAYATAPANSDALTFIRPYQTAIFPTSAAAVGNVVGIAVSAVAQNSWHFEQISGLSMVLGVGSGTTLTINAPAVPSGAAAGTVIGAAASAANQVGINAATTATASGLKPVWLQILNNA